LIRDLTFGILVSTEMNITETLVTAVPCFLAAGLGFALFCLVRHLNTMRIASTETGTVSSPERYRPMLRLLDARDFRYLAESGCSPEVVRKAKADRRAIFRRYLRCLVKDYSRLLAGLRVRILMSNTDRPDLLRAIGAIVGSFCEHWSGSNSVSRCMQPGLGPWMCRAWSRQSKA